MTTGKRRVVAFQYTGLRHGFGDYRVRVFEEGPGGRSKIIHTEEVRLQYAASGDPVDPRDKVELRVRSLADKFGAEPKLNWAGSTKVD